MQYYYIRKTFLNLSAANSDTTNIRVGDYFFAISEAIVYLRTNNTVGSVNSEAISPQPVTDDKLLSILDNKEWKKTSGGYVQQDILSVGAAILLAIQQYNQGATKPKPLGLSNFPETIDDLKILDYSSDSTADGHLKDYYEALSAYYENPDLDQAAIVNNKAELVQNYILTETDYNKLASAVLNIQLYLKQYVEDEFVSVSSAIESYIQNLQSYTSDSAAYLVKVGGSSTPGPSAVLFVKNATGSSGSNTITVSDKAELYVGMIVSGSGIYTGATISAISPSTNVITLSNNNTGPVNGSVSFSGTKYYIWFDTN